MNLNKRQILVLLFLIIVLVVPAIHKLSDQIPPNWFIGKFENSIIAKVPFGLSLSYAIILLLEIIGPAFFIFALLQGLRNKKVEKLTSNGFLMYYLLFLILTFGSFLVEDYDNAFQDFMYFVGVVILERSFFKSTLNS